MKEDNHIFQGLRRDNHPIKQKSEYLWDAHNIRLTNRDDSTLLSITNERGTLNTYVAFNEHYVGHCVLGKYLVIFTATEDDGYSYIYRVEKINSSYKTIKLYTGYLNLNPHNPIEAIGVYETELVQKVYWVDGRNQPRVINITKPELKAPKESIVDSANFSGLYPEGSFDFVRNLQLQEQVEVIKIYGQGEFSPGTIQYAFSYYNKYEQESNIFYTTPLYYVSPKDRGGNPEEKVSCSFNINIINPDTNFEYVRIYSIHRTSIDAVPTVKIVEDIIVNATGTEEEPVIGYTDTGTTGSTIDPTQLLYIGGESLIANCITHKDNTLFLGNISQGNDFFNDVKDAINNSDYELDDWTIHSVPTSTSSSSVFYDYTPDLSSSYNGAFKCGETYRLGLQVQYDNGKWSEPIFMGDNTLCDGAIWITYPAKASKAFRFIDREGTLHRDLNRLHVKRIRTCVVFPKTNERSIICQGVLCPTVFGVTGRRSDSPYAMSSWFFRPATGLINNASDIWHGASIQFKHNCALFTRADRGAEIQNMLDGAETLNAVTSDNVDTYNSHFFVDENIVTFHSPDIEFDTNLANTSFIDTKLRIVGIAKLGAISGDIDLQLKTPPIGVDSTGYIHMPLGYQTKNNKYINGGLISAPFYRDNQVNTDFKTGIDSYWMVYPWHRSGSMNNDSRRPSDSTTTQSAILSKKKISNLKFFDKNEPIWTSLQYDISTPQLFMSNEISLVKISPSYLKKEVPYMGNVDTIITPGDKYPLYFSSTFAGPLQTVTGESVIADSLDPVRMKYKSSPHLVFSLGNKYDEIQLLPRHASITGTQTGPYTFPDWQQSGSSDGSNDDKGKYDYIISKYSDDLFALIAGANINDVGTCLVYIRNNNGVYNYSIYRIDNTSSGITPVLLTGTTLKLKVKYKVTQRYHTNLLLPGIKDVNFIRDIYRGSDKYYEATYDITNSAYTLKDITNDTITVTRESSTPTYNIMQDTFGDVDDVSGGYPYLLIGELIRIAANNDTRFGGTSEEALKQNLWIPAGRPVTIPESSTSDIVVPFEWGDTWYSRYDCLKTYPFTQEDENSIIEIGSFMCETRVNIDGRYDRNRGQISNINMTPQNFNLINEVYTQKDNFFNYRILDNYYYKQNKFINQITWSKEKHVGEDIDTWTNITLANTLDMDGSKGKVTSLNVFNDSLICFQDKAVSQILFNSRVQIPVSDGVPVEITNGYKVDGSRFISDNVGCQNKWTTITTPLGIYFIDNYTNAIWLYNGNLTDLSEALGMKWWVKANCTNTSWDPLGNTNDYLSNGIRTFYDPIYKDVYFTPGSTGSEEQKDALCYSEQLGQFTSQMSYGGTQAMFQFGDGFFSLNENYSKLTLYENFKGKYNDFFGNIRDWDFSFISNDNPLNTKIFDTIELRTDHWLNNSDIVLNTFPMNFIEASNEYQNAITTINDNNMRRKFRIWRGLIPRSSLVAKFGTTTDIKRSYGKSRIRNPWTIIKLGWDHKKSTQLNNKAVIHDVSVKYTI